MKVPFRILNAALFALAFSAGASAFALEFTIEPYAGYEFGYDVQGTTAYSESGPDFGLRAGLNIEGFIVGADYMMGNLSVSKPGANFSIKTADLGAYVGYDASTVRFWGTYWLSSSGSPSTGSSYSGSGGYTLGLAIKVYELLSVFVEKNVRTYTSQGGSDLSPDIRLDGTLVGVSLPFSF
jgi:hypothetical protein